MIYKLSFSSEDGSASGTSQSLLLRVRPQMINELISSPTFIAASAPFTPDEFSPSTSFRLALRMPLNVLQKLENGHEIVVAFGPFADVVGDLFGDDEVRFLHTLRKFVPL